MQLFVCCQKRCKTQSAACILNSNGGLEVVWCRQLAIIAWRCASRGTRYTLHREKWANWQHMIGAHREGGATPAPVLARPSVFLASTTCLGLSRKELGDNLNLQASTSCSVREETTITSQAIITLLQFRSIKLKPGKRTMGEKIDGSSLRA